MGKRSKAGGIAGRVRPRTASKTTLLTQFPETARRLSNNLDLSHDERVLLKAIDEAKCQRELERMKFTDTELRERVKLWDENYKRKRAEKIELAHRK